MKLWYVYMNVRPWNSIEVTNIPWKVTSQMPGRGFLLVYETVEELLAEHGSDARYMPIAVNPLSEDSAVGGKKSQRD